MSRAARILLADDHAMVRRGLCLVLDAQEDDGEEYLLESIRAGARGYVLTTAVDRDLVDACRTAIVDGPFVRPDEPAGPAARPAET